MKNVAQEYNQHLKEQTEGKLFVNYGVIISEYRGDFQAMLLEHFYVVRNGICYAIHPETMKESPSNDPLIDVVTQCKDLGPFEENKHLVVRTEFNDIPVEKLKKFFTKKTSGKK